MLSLTDKAKHITERKNYLDILKVIATFGVIFLHVFARCIKGPLNTYNWYVSVVGDSLVRWSVPIFVMISGALFLNPIKDLSTNIVINKYVKRLLMAYVFWYFFYCSFNFVRSYFSSSSLVIDYNLLEPEFHLWFLPMLMGVYLLIPILRKVASDIKLLIYALTIWSIYLTVSFILILDISQISNLFTMNIVVGYAGYFLLGYFLSLDLLLKQQRFALYFFSVIGALITIFGSVSSSLSQGFINTKYLYYISPQVLVMAAALFVFVKRHSSKFENSMKGFIDYVRKDLFGIYLVHIFWLNLIDNGIIRNMFNYAISFVVIALLVFIFSLYTTKLLRKIPFLSQFVE